MLLLVFRSLVDAALALFPVTLGWLWMLGLMPPLGLHFDIANMVALPLVLGIGVDAGVHVVHRYRESRAAAGPGGHARLADLVEGTGAAVLVSSLTTMVGFGALIGGLMIQNTTFIMFHLMLALGYGAIFFYTVRHLSLR